MKKEEKEKIPLCESIGLRGRCPKRGKGKEEDFLYMWELESESIGHWSLWSCCPEEQLLKTCAIIIGTETLEVKQLKHISRQSDHLKFELYIHVLW